MLDDASNVLHKALNEKVFLKSISVVVPSSWRDSQCNTVIRTPKGETPYRKADILVSAEDHPIYGAIPFTQQSKGCGQHGDFMSMPFSFLTSWNRTWEKHGDPAKLFVHEWAKLRYGIFDEFGFNQDQLYPNYFFHKGHILPTGTTNVPVKGTWVSQTGQAGCDPLSKDNECYFQPSGNNNQVTCSLGYLHFLPNVTSFCDASLLSHGPMAPTKHNVLCEGRTASEVIRSNRDFSRIAKNNNNVKQSKGLTPIVQLVREPTPQYVLVMGTTSSMDDNEEWRWINKAAQKFIRYDLPVDSNLAIVTFSNGSEVEHPMTQISSTEVRARLADTIPDKYHLSRSGKRCVLCAVQKVVHGVLSPESLAGTHIVLLTKGANDAISPQDEKILENYILDYNIKLSAIVLNPESGSSSFFDKISQSMGGRTYVVNNEQSVMNFFVSVNEAFADVLRSDARYPTEMSEVIHRQEFHGSGALTSTGNFLIDSTVGRDTQFGIYVEDEEEHRIKSIGFTDSKGMNYGPFDRMSSTYDLVNFKTINFPTGEAPPFSAVSVFTKKQ